MLFYVSPRKDLNQLILHLKRCVCFRESEKPELGSVQTEAFDGVVREWQSADARTAANGRTLQPDHAWSFAQQAAQFAPGTSF